MHLPIPSPSPLIPSHPDYPNPSSISSCIPSSSYNRIISESKANFFDRPCLPKRIMATAMYPPPPPYYKLYKDYSTNPNSAPEPPPPIKGTYVCFGGNYTAGDVLPSLEEQGVPELYPKDSNVDGKKELLIISAYGYGKKELWEYKAIKGSIC